jgi:hypothetical protein
MTLNSLDFSSECLEAEPAVEWLATRSGEKSTTSNAETNFVFK